MVYFGTIMETTKDKTYVFTLDCDMIALKTKEDYYVGQQVSFQKKDFYKASNIINITSHKNFKFITSIAAIFFLAIIIAGGAFLLGRGTAGGFDENVMALVSVDINPSIEFEVNKDDEIISANCYNDEGQEILDEIDFRGMVLEAGIQEVIKAAKELGYINEDVNIVLISGTVSGEDEDNSYATQLKNILNSLQGSSGGTSVMSVYVDDSSVYDLAEQNDISIGKALLYQYAIAQGLNVSLDDIRNSSITQLLTTLDIQVAGLEVDTQTPTETTTVAEQTTTQQTTTRPSGGSTSSWSPTFSAYNANSTLFFNWNPLTGTSANYNGGSYYNFKYYKVVYSKTDPTPVYGESGTNYITYFSNYSQSSYSVTPQDAGLESGATYYFAITYVFENGKFSSEVKQMTVPTYTVSISTPTMTRSLSGNDIYVTWDKMPGENVMLNGTTYYNFDGYKVVYSTTESTPEYGESNVSYQWINNINTGSTTLDLPSGSYYVGITYLFNGHSQRIVIYNSEPVTIP